jgi:glyoxylate/hydroxypyruvate reductase A
MTETANLRISVVHPQPDARAHWCRALRTHLPAAQIVAWDDDLPTDQPSVSTEPTGRVVTHIGVGWKPSAGFFAAHPGLAAFFTAGAGVDHLLALPALPPAMPVIRLEDAGMAEQMFSYCLHEILRRLQRADGYEALQREGRWHELGARSIATLPVGVVGLGALGGAVAQRLAQMGFPVSGYSLTEKHLAGVACHHGAAQWPVFLAACEVLILLAPLTPQTRHLIDAHALAALPPGGWLINVARGALIDETALLAALASGHLAGAALDVFQTEPLPATHLFWQHPKIRLTPHVSAQTLIDPSARQVADKILRLQQGHCVSGIVDRNRGY